MSFGSSYLNQSSAQPEGKTTLDSFFKARLLFIETIFRFLVPLRDVNYYFLFQA